MAKKNRDLLSLAGHLREVLRITVEAIVAIRDGKKEPDPDVVIAQLEEVTKQLDEFLEA